MTLGVQWVRSVGGIRELVVASDSRLNAGQHWDGNPKIMLLPRSDCVLSFSGDTDDAYPLMLQAWNAVEMHGPAKDRSMDIAELKGHLIRMFNHSRTFISRLPRGQSVAGPAKAIFALSGYSWRTRRFHIWKLHHDKAIGKFTFRPATKWGGQVPNALKLISWLGDDDAIGDAKKRLVTLLKERGKISIGSLDMEPFEVLRDIIRAETFASVGGPVQLVKIYEHANTTPVGVFWPDKKPGNVCVFGRRLMKYERIPWGVIDPDSPDRAHPFSAAELYEMPHIDEKTSSQDGEASEQ